MQPRAQYMDHAWAMPEAQNQHYQRGVPPHEAPVMDFLATAPHSRVPAPPVPFGHFAVSPTFHADSPTCVVGNSPSSWEDMQRSRPLPPQHPPQFRPQPQLQLQSFSHMPPPLPQHLPLPSNWVPPAQSPLKEFAGGNACIRPPPGLQMAATSTCATATPQRTLEELSSFELDSGSDRSCAEAQDSGCTGTWTGSDTPGKTTLMVRNVPVLYTQDMLLEEWSDSGKFDFLYLPRTAAGKTNLSYAFVNFCSEDAAVAFLDRWHKQRLNRFGARKTLNISFAEVQGFEANVQQVRKRRSRCSDERQCRPIVLAGNEYVSLDEAATSF